MQQTPFRKRTLDDWFMALGAIALILITLLLSYLVIDSTDTHLIILIIIGVLLLIMALLLLVGGYLHGLEKGRQQGFDQSVSMQMALSQRREAPITVHMAGGQQVVPVPQTTYPVPMPPGHVSLPESWN